MDALLLAAQHVPTPVYLLSEQRLRQNLSTIARVATAADVEIILALKAYALWKTFPLCKEYVGAFAASALGEAHIAAEVFGKVAHTFSPAYSEGEFAALAALSSHLTFNSLSQYARFAAAARAANAGISIGLRVNPDYCEVATDLYNPCARGSRLGIAIEQLPAVLPADVEGLHVHCHCESGADALQRFLAVFVPRCDRWLRQVRWLNLGGGHLLTREGYDIPLLLSLLASLRARYPHLHIILEPGSAFAWQTGILVAQVEDIVENKGLRTALLNVSFTCHMPDCLEMPYHPTVYCLADDAWHTARLVADGTEGNTYRLGGCSCLAGDYMAAWQLPQPLHVGDRIVFDDMLHYTTVKTTMFNGIAHPTIALLHHDGSIAVLRQYGPDDYKQRMD